MTNLEAQDCMKPVTDCPNNPQICHWPNGRERKVNLIGMTEPDSDWCEVEWIEETGFSRPEQMTMVVKHEWLRMVDPYQQGITITDELAAVG